MRAWIKWFRRLGPRGKINIDHGRIITRSNGDCAWLSRDGLSLVFDGEKYGFARCWRKIIMDFRAPHPILYPPPNYYYPIGGKKKHNNTHRIDFSFPFNFTMSHQSFYFHTYEVFPLFFIKNDKLLLMRKCWKLTGVSLGMYGFFFNYWKASWIFFYRLLCIKMWKMQKMLWKCKLARYKNIIMVQRKIFHEITFFFSFWKQRTRGTQTVGYTKKKSFISRGIVWIFFNWNTWLIFYEFLP